MAIVAAPTARILIPRLGRGAVANLFAPQSGFQEMNLDAAGKKAAYVFYPAKTGDIRTLRVYCAGKTTNGNVDIRLETVDPATGNPSGTLAGTNTNVTVAISAAGEVVGVLTADFTVTDLQIPLALVVVNSSGSYKISMTLGDVVNSGSVWGLFYNGSSWGVTGGGPLFAVGYSDGSYVPIPATLVPGTYNTSLTLDSTTLKGLRFRMPFPARVAGIVWQVYPSIDWTVKLFDSDGSSVLGTITGDKDVQLIGLYCRERLFNSPVNLLANTYYRLGAYIASSTMQFNVIDVASAAVMDAFEMGQDWHYTSAPSLTPANDAAWTQVLTRRPMLGLILDGFDAGGSGSVFVIED